MTNQRGLNQTSKEIQFLITPPDFRHNLFDNLCLFACCVTYYNVLFNTGSQMSSHFMKKRGVLLKCLKITYFLLKLTVENITKEEDLKGSGFKVWLTDFFSRQFDKVPNDDQTLIITKLLMINLLHILHALEACPWWNFILSMPEKFFRVEASYCSYSRSLSMSKCVLGVRITNPTEFLTPFLVNTQAPIGSFMVASLKLIKNVFKGSGSQI